MATQTFCRIGFAKYGGYQADYHWQGDRHRAYFNDAKELSRRMQVDGVHWSLIDGAVDALELFQWEHEIYPVFRPAEAVADWPEAEQPSRFWDWWAATIRVGAVAAPWVLLVVGVRWLLGGWG